MDDVKEKIRVAGLTASLNKALALDRLSKYPEYQNVLLPYLTQLANFIPLDPTKYKSDEEYVFALKQANMRASVYSELIKFLSRQEETVNKLREQIEKPPKNNGI